MFVKATMQDAAAAGLLPPLAAEILEEWVPLRCSAAGFGIGGGTTGSVRAVQKNQEGEVVACDRENGDEGGRPGGYTGTHGPYSAGGRLEQTQCALLRTYDVCDAIGGYPHERGGQQQQAAPLISAWSAIVHSDIGHGLGSVSPLPIAYQLGWMFPLRISGFLQQHV